jgi:uncharacterized protein (DUF1800 family)
MADKDLLQNKHLLWRAGFGPAVEQLDDLSKYSAQQFYKKLAALSAKKTNYLQGADRVFEDLYTESIGKKAADRTAEERRELQRLQTDAIRKLNSLWMSEMVNSEQQLKEKMALFWHGHFACRSNNAFYQQQLLHIIRDNALGNFGELLKAVSQSPAMLGFLNNQQNRKGRPNENFAREVMELFTLGRGNYTEKDIKEAARAFTGWTGTPQGEFVFRKNQHDTGEKTVLGKTGNFTGEDVLNILLEKKQTAIYITQKIYRFLVNDIADPKEVQRLAEKFYNSNYDISGLLKDIFTGTAFYEKKNMGVLIKSPVELLAGIQRMIPMQLEDDAALLTIQRILGQLLFYPPNVAGWPGGKTWIDSSTLMMRLRVPQLFTDADELNVTPKDDDDQMMGMKAAPKPKKNLGTKVINASMSWDQHYKQLTKVRREELLPVITNHLLLTSGTITKETISKYIDDSSREAYIKTATIQIMSTPEYQLC